MKIVHARMARKHMNTTFEFMVSTTELRALAAETVLAEAHALVATLENELSEFRPHTPVARLNHAAPFERVSFPESGLDLLEACERALALSHGAFDCGVKGARAVKPSFGWDRASATAWRCGEHERLSFAAIGKGYALDRVRERITQAGFTDFLLNAGGSSQIFSGFSAPGEPWRWAWAWSRNAAGEWEGLEFTHTDGSPIALGVSGTAEQGAHLKNPVSGEHPTHTQSALVAMASAADSDALSTALFVSGWEAASKLSEGVEIPALAHIDAGGMPSWNGRFQTLWGKLCSLAVFFLFPLQLFADEEIDLGDIAAETFAPYETTRDPVWILLPLLSLALVLLHLKKTRPQKTKPEASK